MTPRVSVVIPAYGRMALLQKAILSLFGQDLGEGQLEIIVVDSSPDDANERLVNGLAEAAPFPLRYFRKTPEGPGPSRNLGAREAKADFIAFMDSDCQAHAQMLRHSLAAFEPGVGIVQGKTLPDPEGRLGVLTWYPMNETEYFVYECTNIVYRRQAFEAAGGFTPDRSEERTSPWPGQCDERAGRRASPPSRSCITTWSRCRCGTGSTRGA
jgi:glycosyltransferase involved in cell wall biosynthesis